MFAKHESGLDGLIASRRGGSHEHGDGLLIDGLWPVHWQLILGKGSQCDAETITVVIAASRRAGW
jgi:hypothetical protein